MKIKTSASIYFLIQGVSVIIWWFSLLTFPEIRKLFEMGESEAILKAFGLPDGLFLAIGSIAVGLLIVLEHRMMTTVVWFLVGAISYTTFYCLSFAIITDTGWLGVTAMAPAMVLSGNFAIGLTPAFQQAMFRRSKDAKTAWIILKTLAQIIVVWSLILVVFPLIIVRIEAKLGIPRFTFPLQTVLSLILFPLVSLIGLASAYSMAKIGRGTPLPMDTASKLVVSGIYGYVRNPMAISGIGQGILVGILLGSPSVVLYALLGGFIWQFIYRRLEEDDMVKLFGEEYEEYRRNVRCWIPRFKKY